ncbi:Hcp family type VI secretion system effector [Achromobacter sp. AGC25]|jgi:type VI secretion system secreted protein Hcp
MDTILLQINNIKGNSTVDGYADAIILDSVSHSVSLPMAMDMANTERALGRPNFSELSVSKATDQSTPALYNACASGSKLGDATISIGRNESGKFLLLVKYVLGNAMISNVSTGLSSGGSDSVALCFSTISMEYTQQAAAGNKAGTASFGWDLATNKSSAAKK